MTRSRFTITRGGRPYDLYLIAAVAVAFTVAALQGVSTDFLITCGGIALCAVAFILVDYRPSPRRKTRRNGHAPRRR